MEHVRAIEWMGEPICYKRPKGSGLIVGRFHYLFDTRGQILSVQPISRPVLASLLEVLYADKALAMAAYVRLVPNEDTMLGGSDE